ncbi:serine palmitoyltransferase [Reticulomyxa filosa]|uniref:serine C-palmitoyltransferase n=1 Tax=Reticulomyxa filosa TaxID=46433 RepID=X6N1N0_RETFI|nr:serine palmitoyltransferase [Reticulomyxa filosa]|eukprot:ETO19956.1 serine palmitoyltransferase [Reticulomyxa filosa]
MELYGVSTTSCPLNTGQTALHDELEKTVADFLGVEEAMVFGMGWGTNTTAIPALVGKGCLVISDSLNHNSIVVGARSSGSIIKTFPHNNTAALEKVVRRSIIEGQPRTHRPWKKILIIIEGVYSMEGEICPLAKIVEIKKKYKVLLFFFFLKKKNILKLPTPLTQFHTPFFFVLCVAKCYLYLDEAHSIGAVGVTGRGVCEHSGVNPKDVDVLMGTFTKSFGAIGGYVAGTKVSLLFFYTNKQAKKQYLYFNCLDAFFLMVRVKIKEVNISRSFVLAAFRVIGTEKGKKRMLQLVQNSNLLRETLRERGFHVIGDNDSAVVPVVIGHPAKLGTFSRYCLEKGVEFFF